MNGMRSKIFRMLTRKTPYVSRYNCNSQLKNSNLKKFAIKQKCLFYFIEHGVVTSNIFHTVYQKIFSNSSNIRIFEILFFNFQIFLNLGNNDFLVKTCGYHFGNCLKSL